MAGAATAWSASTDPDGTWAVVWQTAWDSDADADEFASAADAAMADLPGAHVVLRGADRDGRRSVAGLWS